MSYVQEGGLRVAEVLHRFVLDEALDGVSIDPQAFWSGLEALIDDFAPRNRDLLAERARLQQAIDDYHRNAPGRPDPEPYTQFLRSIGYLLDEPDDFRITTCDVDPEIATVAGPQLVVPLLNARYAVNAANARWGSLYDALYGSNVIDESAGRERGRAYNPVRGAAVVERVRGLLDEFVPLAGGSHRQATGYSVVEGGLRVLVDGVERQPADSAQFVGYTGDPADPASVLLVHHGLHLELRLDRTGAVGRDDPAGIDDVLLEAALTTIVDLEDSVAAVDAEDKVLGYRNWLQLMQGRLSAEVAKGDTTFTRTLADDRTYTGPDGRPVTLPGRSVLLIRNVGLLMTTDAVLDRDGRPVPEGILDAVLTALGGLHDLRGPTRGANSRAGSIYVVKPKLHGPDEARFTGELFARVEQLLGLEPATIKLGIMDEERRTSLNLAACVHEVRDRIAFINTGFLDRTGDEIHTSMHAGPVVAKAAMRDTSWIGAYERNNVDVGLACGFRGRAQIGKGMWAAPDELAAMLEQKIGHPEAGASCAWVPSPTAATLHALHYHAVDVAGRQREFEGRARTDRLELLVVPVVDTPSWTPEEIAHEVDNNLQGVLGYVVRWVDAGVGCSKVPDLTGTALMEDRATCRISSQHVANWLLHGVVSIDVVEASLRRMAELVDRQNADVTGYRPMAPAFDGAAFRAASDLVIGGADHPSGYTEPVLHRYRRELKEHNS